MITLWINQTSKDIDNDINIMLKIDFQCYVVK